MLGLGLQPAVPRRFALRLLLLDLHMDFIAFGDAFLVVGGQSGEDNGQQIVDLLQTTAAAECGILFGNSGQKLDKIIEKAGDDAKVVVGNLRKSFFF